LSSVVIIFTVHRRENDRNKERTTNACEHYCNINSVLKEKETRKRNNTNLYLHILVQYTEGIIKVVESTSV